LAFYFPRTDDAWSNSHQEEVLLRVKEKRSTLQTINKRKANWIGHILCRNCLLKHVIDGEMEGRNDWKKRDDMQLLDDVKEMREQWKLKEEALDCTLWRTCFQRGYG